MADDAIFVTEEVERLQGENVFGDETSDRQVSWPNIPVKRQGDLDLLCS